MSNTENYLNCFYDFAVSPAYSDFFTYLQLAELHRIRYSFKKIRIIFVPGPKKGFRDDTLRTTESNELMTRNVLLPACHLLKSCDSILWLDQRELAQGMLSNPKAVFPRDYTLQNPVNDYMDSGIQCAFLRDEVISHFTAPPEKHKAAQAFIKSVCGNKKAITITMREAEHDASPRRSINEPEWLKFFDKLDLDIYQPIIIRDTACAFADDNVFAGYPQAPVASIDLLFRNALYENAYLNCFCCVGSYSLAVYSKCNSLVFKYCDNSVYATSEKFLKEALGLTYGDQRPITGKRTVMAWEDDDTDVIEAYFNFMVEQIESGIDLSEQHNIGSTKQAINTINVAIRYVFNKFNRSVAAEDLKVLYRIQQISEILKESSDWNYNLKTLITQNEGKAVPEGTLDRIKQLEETVKFGLKI